MRETARHGALSVFGQGFREGDQISNLVKRWHHRAILQLFPSERSCTDRVDAGLIRSFQAIVTKETSMKSSAKVAVKGKFHEVKGKNRGQLGKLMNDPTLEGKDENTVRRVQRKIRQTDNGVKK
jgi:hypothetical protein